MSITYREAWGLFQFDQSPTAMIHDDSPHLNRTSRSSSHSFSPIPTPASICSEQSTSIPNKELFVELRRLRHDLQQLQHNNGVVEEPREAMTQMSARLDQITSVLRSDPSGRPTLKENPSQPESFRCLESCCKGRLFSNKSNLIRHQRERRGETAKLRCSFCDAVFSRSSARNAHEAARRCRNP